MALKELQGFSKCSVKSDLIQSEQIQNHKCSSSQAYSHLYSSHVALPPPYVRSYFHPPFKFLSWAAGWWLWHTLTYSTGVCVRNSKLLPAFIITFLWSLVWIEVMLNTCALIHQFCTFVWKFNLYKHKFNYFHCISLKSSQTFYIE